MRTVVHEWTDPARPRLDGDGHRPVRVHVTAPDGEPRGTIVVSHGTGGSAASMRWIREALAEAGFLVAAVDHHGNNYIDGYLPQGFVAWWDRPADLSFTLDRLDVSGLVGAFGFSLGGYTASALVGARVHEGRFVALLGGDVPLPPTPEFPDIRAAIFTATTAAERAAWPSLASADLSDDRVSAAFLLCPAIGEVLDEGSLAAIDRPVAVRWGGADVITPSDTNGRRYAGFIPAAEGSSAGDDVGHYWFLDAEPVGVAVREVVAAEAVDFFTRTFERMS